MDNNGKYCVEIAFQQIFSISRFVGTFPLDRHNKLSWSLLVFCIDFIIDIYITIMEFSRAISSLHAYLGLLRWGLLLPATFVNFGCLYFKLDRLLSLFKEMLAFEEYLLRIGVNWNYKHKWWNKYLGLLVAFNSIGCWFYNFNLKSVARITLKRLHVYIALYTVIDQVTGTTSLLASAIAHLKYIREDRELLKKYEQLTLLCRTAEDYFGPQLVAITAWSFVSLVAVTFWYAVSTVNPIQTICIFLLTSFPLLVIYPSFLSIVYQTRKIDKLLYRRLLANPTDMIGAGITYLVILLQYGK